MFADSLDEEPSDGGAGDSESPPQLPTTASTHLDWTRVSGSCVEYYGPCVNSCGYCKSNEPESNGRRSYELPFNYLLHYCNLDHDIIHLFTDMQAHKLKVDDYQTLIDRGWRRSGHYCYHPINANTCCPNYSISCKAVEFKLSRSQRRCIENLNSFLVGRDRSGQGERLTIDYNMSDQPGAQETKLAAEVSVKQSQLLSKSFEELKASPKARARRFVRRCELLMRSHNKTLDEAISLVKQRWTSMQQRRHLKQQSPELVLENFLYPKRAKNQQLPIIEPKHRFEIHMKHVKSAESKALRDEEHLLMQAYQRAIHKDDPEEWDMSRYCDFLVNSPLIPEGIRDRDYTRQAYSEQSDENFCVTDNTNGSEFLLVRPPELPTVFGTYHCTYHLDGKLIAVGVLDILPKCITTVYFFYDPNYSHLNLGIYSALIEISMVRRIAAHYNGSPGQPDKLIHYYMGFYVHECAKMRYKTTFKPSYLLCSETLQYIPIEQCLKKLVDQKYARFSDDDLTTVLRWTPSLQDIATIPILSPIPTTRKMLDYLIFLETYFGVNYVDIFINNFLIQYVKLVGKSLLLKLTLRVSAVHRAITERHRMQTAITRSNQATATSSARTSTDEPTTDSSPAKSGLSPSNERAI